MFGQIGILVHLISQLNYNVLHLVVDLFVDSIIVPYTFFFITAGPCPSHFGVIRTICPVMKPGLATNTDTTMDRSSSSVSLKICYLTCTRSHMLGSAILNCYVYVLARESDDLCLS